MSPDPRLGKPSASSMDRLAHCPGSANAQAAYSEPEADSDTADVATEGDEIHAALATGDFSDLEDDAEEIAQRQESMRKRILAKWQASLPDPDAPFTEYREQRFWIKSGEKLIASAQVDYAAVSGADALVIDYKTGFKAVTHSSGNYQIRTQAVALWRSLPGIKRVRGAVAAFRFVEQETVVDYKLRDLISAEKEIKFFVWRSTKLDAERVPGPWCDYCKAKADCREAASKALLPVPMTSRLPSVEEQDLAVAVSQMSLVDLAYMHARRSLAEKVFTAIANRLRNTPREDLATVGLKITPGKARISRTNISGAFKALKDAGLVDASSGEFQACCDFVVGRISELVVPRLIERGAPSKKAALAQLNDLLSPFITRITTIHGVAKMNKEELKQYEQENSERG